jgi:hypothetical protein
MQTQPQFSWLREVVVPVIFVLLGSVLGFIASQFGDDWKANQAKKSFLIAIGMELVALGEQLDAWMLTVTLSKETLARRGDAPKFAAALQTTVFTSQIGKIRDMDDVSVIDVIRFYSELGTLQQMLEGVNQLGDEYNRANVPSGDKERLRFRLDSGLDALKKQILSFGDRLMKLQDKLEGTKMVSKIRKILRFAFYGSLVGAPGMPVFLTIADGHIGGGIGDVALAVFAGALVGFGIGLAIGLIYMLCKFAFTADKKA